MEKQLQAFKLLTITVTSIIVFNSCTKSSSPVTPTTSQYGGDKGQETIWASNTTKANYPIDISIGGNYIGTISASLASDPDCNNSNDNVVKFDAEPGTYNLVGKSSAGQWTGTFTLQAGTCATLNLK